MTRLTLALLLLLSMSIAPARQTDKALMERAQALHSQVPLIDGHNDYPWALRENAGRDLAKLDISKPQPSIMTDIARLRAGGVGGQFWSVYVPADLQGESPVTATLEQIDIVHRMMRKYPDTFELALTADDVERIFKKGKIASLIGMEGGHSIDSSLAALRMFHRLGARYMTLTHSRNVPWADSATDTPVLGGLSAFGEEVVREMNWLGMLVDLSHVSPETMEDAIRVSEAPVIFSHSSARTVTDHVRNVPDSILRRLPRNGGVVMVAFIPEFVSEPARKWSEELFPRLTRATSDSQWQRLSREYVAEKGPAPRATVKDIADHIEHIRKVAGIDHVGIGADFYGAEADQDLVQGLEDVSKYPALFAELVRRGWRDADLRKLAGENLLRVFRLAEVDAERLRRTRPPSNANFEEMQRRPVP
jgi:membrane dipeptidase